MSASLNDQAGSSSNNSSESGSINREFISVPQVRSGLPSPDISIGLPAGTVTPTSTLQRPFGALTPTSTLQRASGALTPTSTLQRPASSQLGDTLRRVRVASIVPSPAPTPRNESRLSYVEISDDEIHNYSSGDSDDEDENGSNGRPRADRHRSIKLAKREQRRRVLVREKTHESFRLSTNAKAFPAAEDYMYKEPYIHPKVRRRAQKAVKSVVKIIDEDSGDESKSCLSKCCGLCQPKSKEGEDTEEKETVEKELTHLTPEMEKANDQGWDMIKKVLFPSIPAVLQDMWVYLELLITIVAFGFAMLDLFPISDNHAFNYAYLSLIAFSMVLALMDAWVYFFQLGSCARGIRQLRRYVRKRRRNSSSVLEEGGEVESDSEDENEDVSQSRKCCQLSPKWKQYFNTFFELGRNIASELLLYPLLIFDLFDFIADEVFRPEGDIGRADFGLFMVGSFYLILAVYIMRLFVVAGSMLSLVRLPKNAKETGNTNDNFLLIKFCLHVLGQIAVHFTTIVVIGAKINNENTPQFDDIVFSNNETIANETGLFFMNETDNMSMNVTEEDGGVSASPFLLTAIVLGWLLPITGVVMFFIVNIYWMREFSIGFWLNMISLIQGESFAETVFGGQSTSVGKDKALKFVEKSQYKKVKKDLQRYKSPSSLKKFLYPTRIPLAALSGLLYDILIIVFIVCLALTYKDNTVSVVVFKDDHIMTTFFIVSLVSIIVANIHVLLLLNFLLLIFFVIFSLAVALALFWSPFLLLVYIPIVGILGYILLFREIGTSTKKKLSKLKSTPNIVVNDTESKDTKETVDSTDSNSEKSEKFVATGNVKSDSELSHDQPTNVEITEIVFTSEKDSLDKEELEMLEVYQNKNTADTA